MRLDALPKYAHRFLLGSRRLAIFEACVIGLVSGLAAVLLKQGIGLVGGWRIQVANQFSDWLVLPIIGAIGGWLAGWLIQRFAPEAAGSGIPQVKASLANVPMALNLRVALVKMVSVILSLGAGLTLGRQGPTVQIGAALAAQLSRWIPTSPEYRRQLIAAGAAAGLAAGFNAPIAGVLFVVEEFLQDFSGLTLGTAILASFIGAVVSRLLGGQGLSLNQGMTAIPVSVSLQDVPFLLILGLLAGLLGALFCQGIFTGLAINRHFLKVGLPWRIALAGLVSGLIVAPLPPAFRDNTGLQEFLSTGDAGWKLTLVAFIIKFCTTLIAYGSGAPGGLFAPSLILGSSLGYLVGFGAVELETWVGIPIGIQAGVSTANTYALAGMGAFFSAVTRGPITAIVIVFEITADFNLVLPLMICSVVAYLIADRIASGSFYNQLLAWNGIHLDQYQSATTQAPWSLLTAASVMQRRVETLSTQMTLTEAVQAFSRSHHRGFPVIDNGKLVGIVTQSDLGDTSRHPIGSADQILLADIMTPQPVTVHPTDRLNHVLYLLNRFKLSRLPVTDGSKLVGIITRADIIRAECDQISGDRTQLGPRPDPSYVVYQTRSPATGNGRLLVPLINPQTAPDLLRLAAAIAREKHYEVECLHVLTVPRAHPPSETAVNTAQARRLLRQAATTLRHLSQGWSIPVHTQIRLAHDPAQAMLETINDRHIDLMLMGWKGSTATPGRVFGSVVDTIIRQAPCEVILVKLTLLNDRFDRWLVPIAGGPNSRQALQLLPALITVSSQPEVRICQVFSPETCDMDTTLIDGSIEALEQKLDCPILSRPMCSRSVAEAVIQLAWQERCDVILMGASRDGLLQQVIKGNLPQTIARTSNRNVILVREAIAPQQP